MKPFLYGILAGLMCLGLYTLLQASARERDKEAERVAHVMHCDQVNTQVITEFDAIVASGKFPTQDQQDYWVTITNGCPE